ncbi:MaoC family dehydratase [Ammoniphilus sp. CFH 90114]|uniref:MaoC family dehydratase n=1 Tax=Ammoniphilus sp. CFH 90114 TaxID=2493665 RepID=UPI00100F7489|nr:MaoC family dehydratase [Ammoniphilus sp. CFH 90114]RXT08067.1 MaoC family dehydratase [Ammoniphilus sp. CFH 90114]
MFTIGQTFSYDELVRDEIIHEFARLSGDYNRLHTDQEYASRTIFKQPIAHGMLSASYLSALLGTKIVDTSTHYVVYLEQSLKFVRPLKVNDEIHIRAVITEWEPDTSTLRLQTTISNQYDKKVVEGDAVIKVLPLV